jgi:hypothetical protein
MQLESKARIGLIRAVVVHTVTVCEAFEGAWKVNTERLSPDLTRHSMLADIITTIRDVQAYVCEETFDYVLNVLLLNKGHLHIDLCKFRLSIGSKILISITTSDLEVSKYGSVRHKFAHVKKKTTGGQRTAKKPDRSELGRKWVVPHTCQIHLP